MRELVQMERAREVIREQLLSKRFLDPLLCAAKSTGGLPRFPNRSSPQVDLPGSPLSGAASLGSSPLRATVSQHALAGAISAPASPMAAAAARRRQQLLDAQGPSPRSSAKQLLSPSSGSAPTAKRANFGELPRLGNGANGGYGASGASGGGAGPGVGLGGVPTGTAPLGSALGEGYNPEDGDDEVELALLVKSEKRRLAKVQSKVSTALRSQQRVQGLLANCQGGPKLTLTPEELTASIIPTPAKPPDGVDLKVPQDDIRFSGVKLRFLMGLLEALDQNPVLCKSTQEVVEHFVKPLTAELKCRLLDLIPTEHRGQPHHYISHAWGCNARDLLQTLRREMLPPAPPRPPPLGLNKKGGGPGADGKGGPGGPGRARAPGGLRGAAGAGGGEGGVRLPGLGGGTHLPAIGGGGGGTASGGTMGGGAGGGGGGGDAYNQMLATPEAMWRHFEELNGQYQRDLDKALDQVVWLDFICNNQHAMTKKDYGKVAKTVVACGATVLILDPMLTPLGRTWCLFEIMHCLRCKRHLKVFRVEASGGGGLDEKQWDRLVETISIQESRATTEQDRVGILQEVLNTVGMAYVNDTIRTALRLSNADRARQLALRREQLRITMELLQPEPTSIGTEEYEDNLSKCKDHLQAVLEEFYKDDMSRLIIPRDYVSNSARCWDMLCIFAEILERELFREDAKALRQLAWLIFKRHSKQYIEVLYEKELENWLIDSLEHDRKWRRTQAKLKHDAQKKWN
ncbi:hypothetical protein HYH03_011543 [Edaphochlamys debaryana]|uniref:Uncharacterized protein n=1 Tax=Edaphochlamys debaryana TaxID=47281 RepID=A0A836BWE9_9CHLO|nr:hypothetical protein HYH03_011543 [Edaphochlamys debaryana]|eukprot:KAG2490078.1 hypothetical protein HYH03_011543 [Edaphochlamys debaryana]